ncbi:MAG: AAA family ATPase [Clostridia bacterium]|nr:AAA family ATPase [Clostridia bacterium]
MVIIITGASHTGKTALAQKLLKMHGYPYLSIDHLKMGLIRSGMTDLTPMSSQESLTNLLWPIVREMIKTAIENDQNLIVEGCYVPFDWQKDFDENYLENIKYVCLVMTENYIRNHFDDIIKYENIVEHRLFNDFTMAEAIADNEYFMAKCREYNIIPHIIDEKYSTDI